jgi:hypothetical protein
MCLKIGWNMINPSFFDTPYTKFIIQQGVNTAIMAEEPRAARGTTLLITKVAMPLPSEDNTDEWGIVDKTKVAPPPDSAPVSDENEPDPGTDPFADPHEDDDSQVSFGAAPTKPSGEDDGFNENKGEQGCE